MSRHYELRIGDDDPRSSVLGRRPDAILFGGIRLPNGSLCPQRVSYILLHALCGLPKDEAYNPQSFANMSEWAVRGRQEAQRTIVSYILDNWYPDIIRSSMLGGEDGTEIRYELSMKKPMRALKRLKDKKYYASDYDGLLRLMDEVIPPDMIIKYSVFLNIASGLCRKLHNFELSDDIWLTAIELTMILIEPNVYFDWRNETQWVSYLERNLRLLLSLVYYIAVTGYYSLFYIEHEEMMTRLNHYAGVVEEKDEALQQKDSELREIKSAVDSSALEKDALIAKLRKEVDRLTHENQELHARLDDFDSDGEEFDGEPESDESGESCANDGMEEDIPVLHDLPEDGILFVGGHPNMLSKLKPLYPNWTFASAEVWTKAVPEGMRPKYIFLWSNHMSHPLYHRVKTIYGKTTPIGYLTATNLDRLQFEMVKSYSDYLNNQNKNASD